MNIKRVLYIPGGQIIRNAVGPKLRLRLEKALEIWKWNRHEVIIVSGGITHRGQSVPEALLMSRWLQNNGVPAEKIFCCSGLDSFESIVFVLMLLEENGICQNVEINVVTFRLHGSRIRLIFRGHGWNGRISTIATNEQHTAKQWLAELGYLAYTCLDPTGKHILAVRGRRRRKDLARAKQPKS